MLIKFDTICEKYEIPKGIIHIGAHMMEERSAYLSKGLRNTIWVEANPSVYERAKSTIELEGDEKLFNFAATDHDGLEIDFYVTNNGESSSILELGTHKERHPAVRVVKTVKVKTKRMETFISDNGTPMNNHNFLNLDIQGAELMALRGFGKTINQFDFIYTEVNTNYLYKNCALLGEIDEYLKSFGFKRTEIEMTRNEWGDALYVKNQSRQ